MDEIYSMPTLTGSFLAVVCPPWCIETHKGDEPAEEIWHQTPAVVFNGPGDFYDGPGGDPFDVMWACISAEPNDQDGTYGVPHICFDTCNVGQAARLDVAQADAVLADLRLYVDRLQQMRDQLAKITEGES